MRERLLSSGYKEYKPTLSRESATTAYQKRFRDGKGTKYFISIYEYDTSFYGSKGMSYEVSLQSVKMYRGREFTINTEIFSFGEYDSEKDLRYYTIPVEDIEGLVEEYWTVNGFEYYEYEGD